MTNPNFFRTPLVAVLVVVLGQLVIAQASDKKAPKSRVSERAGVTLKLIDVNLLDDDGAPIPGLGKDDFEVTLNSFAKDIYAVEDLCDVSSDAVPVVVPTYIYIDFSQILPRGFPDAVDTIDELLDGLPADTGPIEIILNESVAGVRRISWESREQVQNKINLAFANPESVDPFQQEISSRIATCMEAFGIGGLGDIDGHRCSEYAEAHTRHTKQSLLALSRFLTSIDTVTGRKRLLYIHQSAGLYPYNLYDTRSRFSPMERDIDLNEWAAEIGGTAVSNQVTIYPVILSSGDLLDPVIHFVAEQAVNFSARVSDLTGGDFSRLADKLDTVLTPASKDASCIYRISVELPERKKSRVYRVAVAVHGRLLPYRYALENLSSPDAWMKEVQAVLMNPGSAEGSIFASIVPVRRNNKRWEVEIVVAVDLGQLFSVPKGAEEGRSWELGALLYNSDTSQSWDFVDKGEHVSADEESRPRILYRTTLDDLRPGPYELRAFARDRNGNRMSAGSQSIVLPEVGSSVAMEPIFWTKAESIYAADLPRVGKSRKEKLTRLAGIETPFPSRPDQLSDLVQISRLFCNAEPSISSLTRSDGSAVNSTSTTEERGNCEAVVESYSLPAGVYSYRASPDDERVIRLESGSARIDKANSR